VANEKKPAAEKQRSLSVFNVLEAMLVKFQSKVAASKAKCDLEKKFREFISECE
jgi:hypothetical protein